MSKQVTNRGIASDLILLVTLLTVIFYIARPSPEMRKGSDFADSYAAAQMVRHGQGHRLFDPDAQYEFQSRYLGRVGSYYLHAPFELIPYLLLTGLSLQQAFFLLVVWNGVLLAITGKILSQHLFPNLNWRLLTGLSLLFVPLLLNFLQGQDSLALLLILTLSFVVVQAKQEFYAGCFLACGLFKFHLVLPLVFVFGFSLIRKWRFLAGFGLIAALLVVVSVSICGWGLFTAYPKLLLQLKYLPFAGVNPGEMANLRGLFALIFPGRSLAALIATVVGSLLLLGTVAREWSLAAKGGDQVKGLAFANLILAAILVGYHLSPNDLTLLLLPMGLVTCYVLAEPGIAIWLRNVFIFYVVSIFLPPLHVFLLRRHIYGYMAIPVLFIFASTHLIIKGDPAESVLKSRIPA
jgi:hypothetical protein